MGGTVQTALGEGLVASGGVTGDKVTSGNRGLVVGVVWLEFTLFWLAVGAVDVGLW